MNDIIDRLRTGFVSSEAFGKLRVKAADIIEQQEARIAELEAEIESKRNSLLDTLSDVLDAKDEMLRLGIEQDSFPNMFSKILEILAASKAREAVLLNDVSVICGPVMSAHTAGQRWEDYLEMLSKPTDDSALQAIVQRAGEVMRERCMKAGDDGCSEESYRAVDAIRAIPGVTLEDLK